MKDIAFDPSEALVTDTYSAVDVGDGYSYIQRKSDGLVFTVDEHNNQTWRPVGTYAPHQHCSITGNVATYWPTGEKSVAFKVQVRP